MIIEQDSLALLQEAATMLNTIFVGMPDSSQSIDIEALRTVLLTTAGKLIDNYPYPHPLYAGQMLKPPHPIARLAYALALWINPNNHALDGGKASSLMEKESVAQIAHMLGWDEHLGHLCSGGTIANLEALWISSCVTGRKKVLASQQAHYTHNRLCNVLGLPFESVPCDIRGRMDCSALEGLLKKSDVGTVVATIGTTATGAVDPLTDILALQSIYNFRLHADAAYGGYFTLANNLNAETRAVFNDLKSADSIVIDPHKHGLQPYGCGCVLFKDPAVGQYYHHESPYTYFTSDELHLGEISLECSRPGASAVALWATQQLLPMTAEGDFAKMISRSREAALTLYEKIRNDDHFLAIAAPELDIVVWSPKGKTASQISLKSRQLFEACQAQHLFLALADIPVSFFQPDSFIVDQPSVTCLRSCLMKPEHFDWIDAIWQRIDSSINHLTDGP